MELISLQGKTNFFESRVSAYQLANMSRSATPHHRRSGSSGDDGKITKKIFRTDAYF